MNKNGQIDLEEMFKSAIAIIFLIVFLSALAPLLGTSNVFGLSSWVIGLTIFVVILAFFIKILEELGVLR